MTFLEALATERPMRRRAWQEAGEPEWKWLVSTGIHGDDGDWYCYDSSDDGEYVGREDIDRIWYNHDEIKREDFLATDWEVLP